MPFLGRDFRSPGDEWVKTKQGWERLKLWRVKVFENLNENFLARLLRLALCEWNSHHNDLHNVHQPYIHFVKGISKERKVLTTVSEAFVHLDMSGAVRDIRRFNYVCKLLELILEKKLLYMSGTAQKYVFNILEEMVKQVSRTQNDIAAVWKLLEMAKFTLQDGTHGHIGCSGLWNGHIKAVDRMHAQIRKIELKERKEDGKVKFIDLPEDCLRCILYQISDHKDIIHAGQTNSHVHGLSQETLLWKQLCFFHFTNRQLMTFLPEFENDQDKIDWRYIYRRCFLRFGRKHIYGDMLAICRNCDNIFWRSIGHPCHSEEKPASRPLTPEAFIQLFQF